MTINHTLAPVLFTTVVAYWSQIPQAPSNYPPISLSTTILTAAGTFPWNSLWSIYI